MLSEYANAPSLETPDQGVSLETLSPFFVIYLMLGGIGLSLFSRSVVSDSLRPHELQHARLLSLFHYLPEFAQTHVHRDSDAIQPSYPLSSPSPLPSIKTMRGRYFRV